MLDSLLTLGTLELVASDISQTNQARSCIGQLWYGPSNHNHYWLILYYYLKTSSCHKLILCALLVLCREVKFVPKSSTKCSTCAWMSNVPGDRHSSSAPFSVHHQPTVLQPRLQPAKCLTCTEAGVTASSDSLHPGVSGVASFMT